MIGETTVSLRRLLQVVVVFLAAVSAELVPGQTNTSPRALPINRFLLVVETSHAMQRRSEGTLRTVNDLIASRIRGQLRLSDSIGVWTFNETLFTGKLPLQEWSEGERTAIASKIFNFLQEQKYEKQGRLDKLLPALLKVVKNSQFITVILISDGSQEFHGTPFDTQINQLYKQWSEQQQKSRMPFVTVLRAERGQLTNYSVTPAPFPVEMPPLPVELIKPKTLPPTVPVVSAPKPAPPPMAPPLIISGRKPAPPPIAVPATNSTDIVQTSAPGTDAQTGARVAQIKPTDPSAISSALQEQRPAEPPPTAAPPAKLLPATTQTPAAGLESTQVKKLSEEPLPTTPSPVSNTVETKTGSDVAVSNVAASQPDRPPLTPEITPKSEFATTSGTPTSSLRLITVAGLAVAGLVAIGGLWFWKRRAQAPAHASLITRSLDRDKH